jgi:hypothetical protein
MDIHEQFSQSRSSLHLQQVEDIGKKEYFGLRPGYITKTRQEQEQNDGVVGPENVGSTQPTSMVQMLEILEHPIEPELDESERLAMEQFEAEHPGWARFDVDIVIKTVVYAGEFFVLFRSTCQRLFQICGTCYVLIEQTWSLSSKQALGGWQ